MEAVYRLAESGALYPLPKSAQALEARIAAMPEAMRGFAASSGAMNSGVRQSAPTPHGAVGQHKLVKAGVELMHCE